ncbi:hypothetical protein Krac_7457 [Ktedonobacter racemifer DSM 44963]|uniref:Uncharacterized protein n=1 Tax=Ktedonobacter racemifer DSM 44963 TaxID=485913 RepID=D6TK72_KTERA|nr:hypothetical protein Krac_7457 [Ktedonobacter racemifer DSM 44963]
MHFANLRTESHLRRKSQGSGLSAFSILRESHTNVFLRTSCALAITLIIDEKEEEKE